jgi:hypothetical protein
MEFPVKYVEALRAAHASCHQELSDLRAKIASLTKDEQLLGELLAYSSKGWALHFLAVIDREKLRLQALRSSGIRLIPELEEAYKLAREESDRIMRHYPGMLEEGCKAAEIPIDQDSRHPRYTFNEKFILLEVDDRRGTARLSDREGRLGELPADIPAVIDAVKQEQRRLFGRPFDGKKFILQLRAKYKIVLRRENLEDGASVPIRKITARLGKDVKGFKTDEFLVDLSRLVESGPLSVDGRTLDLQQTKDTNDGMLLPGAAGRGYIGFVLFREA